MESSIGRFASATSLASFTCRNCARRTEFEQPPCPDGHGQECPEWYCTECGAATLIGWSVVRRERRRGSRAKSGGTRVA